MLVLLQLLSYVQLFDDPIACSPPGSTVYGISQARILEWVAIFFSRGSSQPWDRACISCISGRFFATEPPGKSGEQYGGSLKNYKQSYHMIQQSYSWAYIWRKTQFNKIHVPQCSFLVAQRVCLQNGRPGFDPWVGKIPWRRKWQPTPVFLPGKSQGWRSLAGYSPWGLKELDSTEKFHFTSPQCSLQHYL